MKFEGFKTKPTERLKGELRALQIVVRALAMVLFFLYTLTIYGMMAKENKSTFIALLGVAISCSVILPFQVTIIRKIKKELRLRESTI